MANSSHDMRAQCRSRGRGALALSPLRPARGAVMTRAALLALALLTTFAACLKEDCIDWEGKLIPHGLLYVPGPNVCSICVCYHSEPMWCKAIYCDPPYFCENFRVGARCCEFECLDPPGENKKYLQRERLRALIVAGKSSASAISPTVKLKAGISVLAVAIAGLV